MDKELGQQRMKVNHLGQQRQVIGRRLENLEQNLAENKVVWMELLQTEKDGADPQCYKSGAGILVPQKLCQIKELVDKRGNAMQQEMEHLKKGFSDVSKKFGEENKALQELVQKAQQIKEALA